MHGPHGIEPAPSEDVPANPVEPSVLGASSPSADAASSLTELDFILMRPRPKRHLPKPRPMAPELAPAEMKAAGTPLLLPSSVGAAGSSVITAPPPPKAYMPSRDDRLAAVGASPKPVAVAKAGALRVGGHVFGLSLGIGRLCL